MTFPALRNRCCPLCGGRAATPEISSRRRAEHRSMADLRPFWFGIDQERRFFTYHRCSGCGLLYNRDFFDEAQLGDLYSGMPPNMVGIPDGAIAATQRGYFAAISERVPLGGDYLEIGPDVGHVAAAAAAHGAFKRFWLFEPNRAVHSQLRQAVRAEDVQISTAMNDLSSVPDRSVGLAVMVHVLDHLLDPRAMLCAVGSKLRPGAFVAIVTHDERSALRRVLGARWPAFCLQHPELYNPATIRHLLERSGYDGVVVSPSVNHFPIDFLVRQAARAAGLPLPARMRLPRHTIRLRLGNMLTLAQAPVQAATRGTRGKLAIVA